jgi:hypothetical protein
MLKTQAPFALRVWVQLDRTQVAPTTGGDMLTFAWSP